MTRLKFDDGVCDIYHRHETSVGPDTWSEKNDNVSNILDFGNKINAETRLARWLDVNAGLRCQVYAVTDKVYNFLEQRAAVSFGCYNVYGRKNPMYAEIEESSYGGYGLRLTSVFTAVPTIRYTLFF